MLDVHPEFGRMNTALVRPESWVRIPKGALGKYGIYGREGRRRSVEPDRWRQYPLGTPNFGRLAQLVERFRDMKEVRGSSPLAATVFPRVTSHGNVVRVPGVCFAP